MRRRKISGGPGHRARIRNALLGRIADSLEVMTVNLEDIGDSLEGIADSLSALVYATKDTTRPAVASSAPAGDRGNA